MTARLDLGPHHAFPGLHVKTIIPRVGEVPHLVGFPRFQVNSPLVRRMSSLGLSLWILDETQLFLDSVN